MPTSMAGLAKQLPPAVAGVIPGGRVACHQATLLWLFESAFGHPIAAERDFTTFFTDFHALMVRIASKGVRVKAPSGGPAVVPDGSVVVFMDGERAAHSCTATGLWYLAGYNQVGWFSSTGADHGFSRHHVSDLQWEGGVVRRYQKTFKLFATSEAKARAVVEKAVYKAEVVLP